MAQIVTLPKLGQTEEEATLFKWRKKEGETVEKGEILFEVETDKAVLEVESFHEGTLLKIMVGEGETVPIAAPVAVIGRLGEPIPPLPKVAAVTAAAAKRTPAPTPAAAPRPAAAPTTGAPPEPTAVTPIPSPAPSPEPRRLAISPRARALARECAVDPRNMTGTGPGGRIVEKDVRSYLSDRNYGRLRISPAAKTLAVKQGVDITTVERSGPAGRIVRRDIERAVAEQPKPMSRLRQVIARRMAQSFSTVPHYFVTVRADMTDLATLARKAKAGGTACSLTDFIMKATVLALQEFPAVNSTTDGHTVRWHSRVHLGLAVAIEEGLVVPVIRNAEDLSLGDLRQAARTLTARARERTLRPEEMTGSTFTISNMGMLDVDDFTAIINPGESAILAVATARETPCVVNGRVKVRTLMNMTLSADHRIVDGAVAARFVNAIKTTLEDIRLWKRMI